MWFLYLGLVHEDLRTAHKGAQAAKPLAALHSRVSENSKLSSSSKAALGPRNRED